MANIPGISGYVQPGTFARDRVVSRSVSVPGGLRTLALMGFGETTFTLVLGAQGSGQDGNATPSGASRNGRFFTIPNAVDIVKDSAHFITKRFGGNGAVREVCDFIIRSKGSNSLLEFERYLKKGV